MPTFRTLMTLVVLVLSVSPVLAADRKADLTTCLRLLGSSRPKISVQDVPVNATTLLAASRNGYIFERDQTWELPETRGVVNLNEREIDKSTRRALLQAMDQGFKITFNSATGRVIDECARMKRQSGNKPWLLPEVVNGYKELYQKGYVYSLEVWNREGQLIAGTFGIADRGHVEGISQFRDVTTSESNGVGHIIDAVREYYFWSRGIRIFDVEVTVVDHQFKKQNVSAMSREAFALELRKMESEPAHRAFDGSVGQPLRSFEYDFFSVFRKMRESKSYRFKDTRSADSGSGVVTTDDQGDTRSNYDMGPRFRL
jgi:Leu/Phe-tRNA-protein transferase